MVWRVEHFDEIDSTNSYVASQASAAFGEGLVALADYQSAGRGRLDRQWSSPPRASLLCSILLRPQLEADRLQLVVAAVALAARAALVRLSGVRPQLKWPNDLMVGENKLAGLLAEVVGTQRDLAVVVGLGVNLTYPGPEGVKSTSVLLESGLTIAPRALLDLVLEELETRRAQLDSDDGRRSLRAEYERALATIGRTVRVEQLTGTVVARAQGVDAAGQLLIEVDGVIQTLNVGDVIHLRHDEVEET